MNGMLRVFAASAAIALVLAGAVPAATPRLVMISGEPLPKPVLIADADIVFELYQAFFNTQPVDRSALVARPSLRLALFWNNLLWELYVREQRLDKLQFEQGNQFGRFDPAIGDKPALVDVPGYGQWPKIGNASVLRILEAHGVPVEAGETARRRAWVWLVGGALGLSVLGLGLLPVARRIRRSQVVNRATDHA
jgi:hypothetical protein